MELALDAKKAVQKFEAYPKRLKGSMKRALRRVGTAVQGTMIGLAVERGIMRRIYGRKLGTVRKGAISRGKLIEKSGEVIQPIKIKGVAALQDQGGRIKAHRIRPKGGNYLVIGGTPIFAPDGVMHPGANMPAIPFSARAAAQHQGTFRSEMEKELNKLTAETNA